MSIQSLDFAHRSAMFAKLSEIAYSNDIKAVKKAAKVFGFTTVEFYNNDGAQAYRFMSKEDLVIACRGTQPTQFQDIAADLRAMPVVSETVSRVHKGFKKEVDDLWPMVLEDIVRTQNKGKKLWFTGHSLGAAMATIMASRCFYEESIANPEELYTYGSPRTGWPGFVKTMCTPHHRWVNNNDIVTTVPPAFIGYRHDGTMHYLNAYGNVRNFTAWQRFKDKLRGMLKGLKQFKVDNFSDHSITLYAECLDNYANGKENPQS